jgi:hypothetical protein
MRITLAFSQCALRRAGSAFTLVGGLAGAAVWSAAPGAWAQASDTPLHREASAFVAGSGRVATQTRAVPRFEAVTLNGPMRLVLRSRTEQVVTLRADDNLLPLIETRVVQRGGVPTLEIGARSGASFSTRSEMLVTVDLVALSALSVAGSGDVEVQPVQTPALTVGVSGSGAVALQRLVAGALAVSVSGSGGVQADGRADRLSIDIAGSGDVDAGRLECDMASVTIAGSGGANVQARTSLTVSIAGSGNVTHSGAAVPRATVAGSGTVRRR